MKRRINCSNCGCFVFANPGSLYCDECSRMLQVERARNAQLLKSHKTDYIVEDGRGEFRPGARFSEHETAEMLKRGYMPAGAVVRRCSKRFLILGSELQSQELVRLEE